MITKQDLREAIAECEGVRNPNSNTCIKLAAYYTILEYMNKAETPMMYSYASNEDTNSSNAVYSRSNTEFSRVINGMNVNKFVDVMEELMNTLEIVQPRLYEGVINRLQN